MLSALPILPLRNSVLFPTSVVPINVGRPRSVRLVQELLGQERAFVGVISQRESDVNEPSFEQLYTVGTIARVVKVIRLGPSNYSVVLNGLGRMELLEAVGMEPYMRARVRRIEERRSNDVELEALGATLRESSREVLNLMPNLPRETAGILDHVRDPAALADLIAANFPQAQASVKDKQRVLEALDVKQRVKVVLAMVAPQLEVLRVKKEISSMVAEEMSQSQREEMLRQQMSSIRKALGEEDEDDDLEKIRLKLLEARPPDEVFEVARRQLKRLRAMSPQSAEANVGRGYVEWLADLPWSKTTQDDFDVAKVRRCLDEDHHGLEKVKTRVVQFAAVRKLRKDLKGPILLFVGPPGVGKTSLGRSIARSMGRAYERISLGGVRDEAEIRGHRRTYVGALPGRVIRAVKNAGTKNPVIVLDELEKMGGDMRGDPAAALLEVLDPEQNATFRDHYIDVPFDLSQVLFIATANTLRGVPDALLDRMEVIEVAGYMRHDKLAIAREFLVPKQLQNHGITSEQLDFTPEGIETLVDHYTREAGVRALERQIAAVCRGAVVALVDGRKDDLDAAFYEAVSPEYAEGILGPHRYRIEEFEKQLRPGIAIALASSPDGGQLMYVEASKMPGKGGLRLTGNMRNVMQESAATAVSYVRSKAESLRLPADWMSRVDLHLHIPQNGVPKDGPSAGMAMFAAVASLALDCPLRADVAMTGEISLRGRVLEVEGLTQKLLGAHRAGVREVIIPERNRHELEEVPAAVLENLIIHLVGSVEEVLPIVLQPPSEPVVPMAPASEGGDLHPAA